MKKTSMIALVTLALSLTAGCGQPEDSNNDNPQSLCGGEGLAVSQEGSDYCVYRGQAITETGFACPAALPNRHDVEQVVVCSAQASVEQETLEKIEQEAAIEWMLDPPNNTTPNNISPNNTTSNNISPNNTSSGEVEVGQSATFTECGEQEQTPEYCAAEVLEWSYDASSETLTLEDSRAYMNCCGEREIRAFKVGEGSYELRETDDPAILEDGETARCGCMCVFDYGIQIPNVPQGVITVSVKRDAPDSEGEEIDWTGTLDLSEVSGEETLDTTDAAGFCGQE